MFWAEDAFSKNGDCATKALQEAVIAAATWYLLFPRHLVLVYWAPKTLEQDEESLEESQAEGNPSNETEGNPSNEAEENAPIETEEDQPYETNGDNAAYTRPEWNPNFKLKKNRASCSVALFWLLFCQKSTSEVGQATRQVGDLDLELNPWLLKRVNGQ